MHKERTQGRLVQYRDGQLPHGAAASDQRLRGRAGFRIDKVPQAAAGEIIEFQPLCLALWHRRPLPPGGAVDNLFLRDAATTEKELQLAVLIDWAKRGHRSGAFA